MGSKQDLVHLLTEMAELLELKGENPFKVRAYQAAVRTLETQAGELKEFAARIQQGGIKGIGKTMSQHIFEYVTTGDIAYYHELKESIPPVIFEFIRVPGLGPKKALTLYEKLNLRSLGELEYACKENHLAGLAGFGTKTQEKILSGLEQLKKYQGQFLLADMWPLAEKIADYFRNLPGVEKAEVAGSIRRRKETVKDIDIVVASRDHQAVMSAAVGMPGVEKVTGSGSTKTSVLLSAGINLDVRVVNPTEYIYALHHFTGSKEHHIKLRGLAKAQGLRINEYNVEGPEGPLPPVATEAEFYRVFGLSEIAPELREGYGELEAAAQHALPVLVTREDIKGLLHMHTTYSDGSASLQEMADKAHEMGLQYIGITDHSQSAVYAKGLKPEAIDRQRREIDACNATQTGPVLLAGIESDILPDGSLDYPDEILARFDFVIASVHSHFKQSEAEMTRRIIKAMENPYVSMLGHPTGRILLAREGYPVNVTEIIQAAGQSGTMIEINASPYRLDLDWRWYQSAKEAKILLSVNPDAHGTGELHNMEFGLAMARKGGLEASDLLNTLPVETVKRLLRQKRPV